MKQPAPLYYGRVEKGVLILADMFTFKKMLATLEGKAVEITVRKARIKRTNKQNNYYFGVIVPLLGEHLGYDPEEMHDTLRLQFLKTHEDGDLPSIRSTRDLDVQEFSIYIDQCIRLAAENGVVIPSPGEVDIG